MTLSAVKEAVKKQIDAAVEKVAIKSIVPKDPNGYDYGYLNTPLTITFMNDETATREVNVNGKMAYQQGVTDGVGKFTKRTGIVTDSPLYPLGTKKTAIGTKVEKDKYYKSGTKQEVYTRKKDSVQVRQLNDTGSYKAGTTIYRYENASGYLSYTPIGDSVSAATSTSDLYTAGSGFFQCGDAVSTQDIYTKDKE